VFIFGIKLEKEWETMKSSLIRFLVIGLVVIGIVATGIAVNAVDVGPRHGNLRAAQKFIERAINKITAA
jgi:glycerol uptake facilitator-like aquaporin